MSAGSWAIAVLLFVSVLFTWLGAVGLVISRGALAKLHFTALCGSIGIPVGCAALMIQHGVSQVTVKALLVAVFAIVTNAVLTHVTGRAVRVSQQGDWRLQADERRREFEA
ncbi:MAG TPA: monovalent cation/H(+) antiporter subunit G [Terriglobia bacterium]|nr:monovalent cation/H(+) antiporter subunit G [Terriglobia bacterium]